MLQRLKYFFYLTWNWDISTAIHILREEKKGEMKFGIRTTGADELKSLERRGIDIDHSTIYMPVSYDILQHFFAKADIANCRHFLDIGCGKGRAVCVAALLGAKKVSGVDFSKDLIKIAKANAEIVKQKKPDSEIRLYNNDAFYFEIEDDVDIVFLFNPFDDVIMSGVIDNIQSSLQRAPRKLQIIYINPLQKQTFIDADFKQSYFFKLRPYLEGIILS